MSIETKVATWTDVIKAHATAAVAITSFIAGIVVRSLL